VIPLVDGGIFQIEHHAGRSRVHHLNDEFGVISRARHLIALILAPRWQLNPPSVPNSFRGKPMARFFPLPRIFESLTSLLDQCQSTRGKALVQTRVKSKETFGEIPNGVESIRSRIHCKSRNLQIRSSDCQSSLLRQGLERFT
jgi:hypothetical protein